jgi:hypothetical protein
MWDFWVTCSEVSVKHAMVYQLQLAQHHDVAPITPIILGGRGGLRGLDKNDRLHPAALKHIK